MSAVKVVLILLILLAVIFVVVVVLGAGQNNSQTASSDCVNFAQNCPIPPWSETLGDLLGPFSPKLKLQRTTFTLGPTPLQIPVPPETPSALSRAIFGQSLRKATFHVRQPYPCAGIVYQAPAGVGGKLNRQPSLPQPNKKSDMTTDCPLVGPCTALPPSPAARPKPKDPSRARFMILDEGGVITLTRLGLNPCTVELE